MKNIYGIWDKTAKEWNGVFLANNDEHAVQGIENSMIKKLPMLKEVESLELYNLGEVLNSKEYVSDENPTAFVQIWEQANEHIKQSVLK